MTKPENETQRSEVPIRKLEDASLTDITEIRHTARRVGDETLEHSDSSASPSAQLSGAQTPASIGRYRIDTVLGEGGFGRVYLAFDDELQRNVTIKVPHRHKVNTEKEIDAFLSEARMLAKLEHPHVVPVHDVGFSEGGLCFIVSRYIDGADLLHRIREAPLSIGDAVDLIATMAEALHYVHMQGVIHRDIKPSNILLDKHGVPYLADFGLAILEDEAARSNTVAGTPCYMSPEQARGENHLVEATSDVFSLGVVLYELVSGKRLFKGENNFATLRLVQEQQARPLREINRDIPAELERVCMKAISKRATDRHRTALDFAEDLRQFMTENHDLQLVHRESRAEEPSHNRSHSSKQFLGIVPKGLRSFGPEDAHFFLGLLPGPYDRAGIPESILFWKRRVESTDPQNSFRVGLVYGPSGCGKSSFVRAGLLPTLESDVCSIFVEAAPGATEARLLNRLRRNCPYLDSKLDLRESIASLRHGQVMGEGKKVLIVIDQFEQWLYSTEQTEHSELAKALRQCDGEHVKCILLVRDDFWLAFSRFTDHIEVELLQNQNMTLVDLFDPLHARRVLTEFGRAFHRLPEHYSEMNREQRAFIGQAIEGLSENGKVTPVRLALFAEMIKGKPWTASTLRRIGGTVGVGVMFLDENFRSDSAPAEYRVHQKAVRATLNALLPQTGTNLKGHMKSREELLETSSYANRPKEFEALMRMLDSELHLITLTDPEGRNEDSSASHSTSIAIDGHYQLAHDYLVPAIRTWQSRMQRETRKGRAEIRLEERTEIWHTHPESRHLPTWPEWVSIMALTPRNRWDHNQQHMMKVATRRHVTGTILVAIASMLLGLGLYQYLCWNKTYALTSQLATASVTQVSGLLDQLEGFQPWSVGQLQQIQANHQKDSQPYLFSSLALLRTGNGQLDDVQDYVYAADPHTLVLLSEELRSRSDQLKEQFWKHLADDTLSTETGLGGRPFNRRFNAALILAGFDPPPEASRWNQYGDFLTEELIYFANIDRQYYSSLLTLIHPIQSILIERLTNVMIDPAQSELRRSTAQTLLIDLLHDDPVQLTGQLLLADIEQVVPMLPLLDGHRAAVRPLLDQAILPKLVITRSDWQPTARVKATAAALLLRHGASNEHIWAVLKNDGIPDARTQLIQRVHSFEVDVRLLAERLQVEQNNSIRCGLIQAIGEFPSSALVGDLQERTLTLLKGWFSTAQEASLRSVSLWCLRRWDAGPWLQDRMGETTPESTDRNWYVNSHGHTMVRLPPHTPDDHYRVDAATAEVTVEQLRALDPNCKWDEVSAPSMNCPVTHATFHQAAAYCNQLSRLEGLGEDQLCYPDRPDETDPAVELVADYQRRTGYRLPTAEEWFFMDRAGASTDYFFGNDKRLADGFATFIDIGRHGWPVGKSKPNDYGIFDTLTSTGEWVSEAQVGDWATATQPEDPLRRGICGSSFRDTKLELTPRPIGFDVPDLKYSFLGFRVVRSRPMPASRSSVSPRR